MVRDSIVPLLLPNQHITLISVLGLAVATAAAAAAAAAAAGALVARSSVFNPVTSCRDGVIDSPLSRIALLTEHERQRLPYQPDLLPGARDARTPYGSIRVNEWGPEDGRKVLLVHGISTPCIALAGVAEGLASRGCRVMLFDLFGRGYSSTPDPDLYPQDIKLFTTQILLVLASSPIPWTGSDGFALVGYSLGGGIAATFTAYFPNLVNSLILIAPAGLMRPSRIHWTSKLIYGGLLPASLVSWLVRRRLAGPAPKPSLGSANEEKPDIKHAQVQADQAIEAEVASHPALISDSSAPLDRRRPSVSVADVVSWQLETHAGFLPSFISSIQHAPISGQHNHWRLIRSRFISSGPPSDTETESRSLGENKVLLILGKTDGVILADETSEDARQVLGEDGVEVVMLDGGHDVPVTDAEAVATTITQFWAAAED